jgi:hypothetical protein
MINSSIGTTSILLKSSEMDMMEQVRTFQCSIVLRRGHGRSNTIASPPVPGYLIVVVP